MSEMILAENRAGKEGAALQRILPMQRQDFVGTVQKSWHTGRLQFAFLDPPLHEFSCLIMKTHRDGREFGPVADIHKIRHRAMELREIQSDAGSSRLSVVGLQSGNH